MHTVSCIYWKKNPLNYMSFNFNVFYSSLYFLPLNEKSIQFATAKQPQTKSGLNVQSGNTDTTIGTARKYIFKWKLQEFRIKDMIKMSLKCPIATSELHKHFLEPIVIGQSGISLITCSINFAHLVSNHSACCTEWTTKLPAPCS